MVEVKEAAVVVEGCTAMGRSRARFGLRDDRDSTHISSWCLTVSTNNKLWRNDVFVHAEVFGA